MRSLPSETCIITLAEGEQRPTNPTYNFTTEIFFMAQKSMDLGFRTVQEKFTKLNQELNRLQTAYRDAVEGEYMDKTFLKIIFFNALNLFVISVQTLYGKMSTRKGSPPFFLFDLV